jgi:hypothetical protein
LSVLRFTSSVYSFDIYLQTLINFECFGGRCEHFAHFGDGNYVVCVFTSEVSITMTYKERTI